MLLQNRLAQLIPKCDEEKASRRCDQNKAIEAAR
jgi:hypothetical protein